MRFSATTIAIMILWGFFSYEMGNHVGIAEGRHTALNTNPVSEELELVCAGLWVGEQNKKVK